MEATQKTAIVIGATGLVGSNLIKLLVNDQKYGHINIFTRRPTGVSHPKISEYVIDFDKPREWREKLQGDVLFSVLGTTLKQAGSKEEQYKIDYQYQYDIATIAITNEVKDYVLVSAVNANSKSFFFYSRIKGELEDAVTKLPFKNLVIIRPGILYGKREVKRPREDFALKMARFLGKMGIMKKNKPIHARDVAKAMLHGYSIAKGIEYYSGNRLLYLAAKYGM